MHEKFAESEELLSESTDSLDDRPRHHQRSCLTSWISIGALVFSCSVVAALLGFWVGSRSFRDPDSFCLRYTNKYCMNPKLSNEKYICLTLAIPRWRTVFADSYTC